MKYTNSIYTYTLHIHIHTYIDIHTHIHTSTNHIYIKVYKSLSKLNQRKTNKFINLKKGVNNSQYFHTHPKIGLYILTGEL